MVKQRDTSLLGSQIPIAPTAGKPIAIPTLIERLTELANVGQENLDLNSVKTRSKELLHTNLLNHKDPGVKIYVSCCIAEILRICAPSAPYTASQLKFIFTHFIKQINFLKDTNGTYYSMYYALVENLSTVKSATLLCDLPELESLVIELFKSSFDVAMNNDGKQIQFVLVDIMTQIIDEAETLPQQVIYILFSQILPKVWKKADKRDSLDLELPKGQYDMPKCYNMAVQLVELSAEPLQKYICNYFADILVETSSKDSEDDDAEMQDLIKAHLIMIELWKHAPLTLVNVIPQLESEISQGNQKIRAIATQAIGIMIATPSLKNFSQEYHSAYKMWTLRVNDKSILVRTKWLQCICAILAKRGIPEDIFDSCMEKLQGKLLDQDETIRAASCHLLSNLPFSIVTSRLPQVVFQLVSERCKDRRQKVRHNAMETLGRFFENAYQELLKGSGQSLNKFHWIPNKLLHCIYVNDREVDAFLESILLNYLYKFEDTDDRIRSERILQILRMCDEKGKEAAFAIFRRQAQMAKLTDYFLAYCDKYNGGVIDDAENEAKVTKALESIIQKIALNFPNQVKFESYLKRFADNNDRLGYKVLKDIYNTDNTISAVLKAKNEFLKRNEQNPCLEMYLNRLMLLGFNKSNLDGIMEISKRNANDDLRKYASIYLEELSKTQPAVFKISLAYSFVEGTESFENLDENDLKAMAKFAKYHASDLPTSEKFLQFLENQMLNEKVITSTSAAKILCLLENTEDILKRSLEKLCQNLDNNSEGFASSLAAVSVIAKRKGMLFEEFSEVVTVYILENVITKANSLDDINNKKEWAEESKGAQCRRLSLQILCNRLISNVENENANELAKPIMKMLQTIIDSHGDITEDNSLTELESARFRLNSALSLLRLAKYSKYEDLISPQLFERICFLAQDPVKQVRQEIARHLMRYLRNERLPSRWYVLLFMYAYDSEMRLEDEVVVCLQNQLVQTRKNRSFAIDTSLPRLISVLTHQSPDTSNLEFLLYAGKIISFFLQISMNAESASLLLTLCQRVKQVKDSIQPNDCIYEMSELAQLLIQEHASALGIVIEPYPKTVKLPRDIFQPQDSSENASKTSKKNYLDEEKIKLILEGLRKDKFLLQLDIRNSVHKQSPNSKDESIKTRKKSEKKRSIDSQHQEVASKKANAQVNAKRSSVRANERVSSGRRQSLRHKDKVDYRDSLSESEIDHD